MVDLYAHSLDVILAHQSSTGAYVASPNFPTYHYCWFRDGAFTAYAMNLAGHVTSAALFHAWAARAVNARAEKVERAVDKAQRGLPLADDDILHTRYTLNGEDGTREEWPNFQLDGFGTWLWALAEHTRLAGQPISAEERQAASLVAEYLAALWPRPCYDCWEEFPDDVHSHTLAAVYAGLRAAAAQGWNDQARAAADIRRFVLEHAVMDGHFVKRLGTTAVDASLLGLATPYRLVAPDDPRMRATVNRIEADLCRNGGPHRYAADTYYGGGEWVLLAEWLAWYYVDVGERGRGEALLRWAEAQADATGDLPEQVATHLNDPAFLIPWRERWGDIARPLLWSHAKYVILRQALTGRTFGHSG